MAEWRVKFITGQHDVVLQYAGTSTRALIEQLRGAANIPPEKHVRLICAGKELYPDDPTSKASSRVLHCMIMDTPPQPPPVEEEHPPQHHAPPSQQQPPQPAHLEPPPMDWLDMVDPGTVLMWIFGSILGLLWLLFIFCAHMFDRTSVVILCMMTVAFLIPCALSYLPLPSFLQGLWQPPPPPPTHGQWRAAPGGQVVHATGMHPHVSGAYQRQMYGGQGGADMPIPPRPLAPARRGI